MKVTLIAGPAGCGKTIALNAIEQGYSTQGRTLVRLSRYSNIEKVVKTARIDAHFILDEGTHDAVVQLSKLGQPEQLAFVALAVAI